MVEVGRLVKPHGVRGEIKLAPYNPASDLFRPGLPLLLQGIAGGARRVEVLAARPHKGGFLLRLAGVETMTEAERLVGARVSVAEADLPPLSEGEFYWFQIVGLEVATEAGTRLGRVVEILETPAHDVYVVRDGDRERLVPAVDEVVVEIDRAAGRLVVRPIEGLLEP